MGAIALLFGGGIWSKVKLALAALVLLTALIGLGYVGYLKYELSTTATKISTLTTQRDIATSAAEQNALAANTIAKHDKAVADINGANATRVANVKEIGKNAQLEIAKAPKSDDGVLSPDLKRALGRLRELNAAAGQ